MPNLARFSRSAAVLLSLLSVVTIATAQRPHGGAVPNDNGTPATEAHPAAMMMNRAANQNASYYAFRNAVTSPPPVPVTPSVEP